MGSFVDSVLTHWMGRGNASKRYTYQRLTEEWQRAIGYVLHYQIIFIFPRFLIFNSNAYGQCEAVQYQTYKCIQLHQKGNEMYHKMKLKIPVTWTFSQLFFLCINIILVASNLVVLQTLPSHPPKKTPSSLIFPLETLKIVRNADFTQWSGKGAVAR